MAILLNKLCVSDSVMLSQLFIALIPNQISFTHTDTDTHMHAQSLSLSLSLSLGRQLYML